MKTLFAAVQSYAEQSRASPGFHCNHAYTGHSGVGAPLSITHPGAGTRVTHTLTLTSNTGSSSFVNVYVFIHEWMPPLAHPKPVKLLVILRRQLTEMRRIHA